MKVFKFFSLTLAILFSFLLTACGGGVEKETIYVQGATVTSVITNTVTNTVTIVSSNTPPPGTDVSVLPNSCDPNIKDVVAGEKRLALICFRLSTNSSITSFALRNLSGANLENVFNFSGFVLKKSNSNDSVPMNAAFEDGLLILDLPNRFYANSQNGISSGNYYVEAGMNADLVSVDIGKTIEMKFAEVQTYSANKKVFIGDDVKGNKIKIIQDSRFELPTIETRSSAVLKENVLNFKSFTFKCESTASYCSLSNLRIPKNYQEQDLEFYDGTYRIYPSFSSSNENPWTNLVNLNIYVEPGTTKEITIVVQTYPPLPSVGQVYPDYFYIYDIEADVSGRRVIPKIKNSNCENVINDGNCKG